VLKAMLFAKVKSVFLGIATLALVTTGVGVLAQTGTGTGPAPDDRLKVMEQKLDKLLEVLGGSNRPASTPPAPAVAPAVPQPPPSAPPVRIGSPDTVPTPSVNVQTTTPRALAPSASAPEVAPDPFVATGPARSQGRGRSGSRSVAGQAQSLAGRVQTLESRLDEVERRLGALERRLEQIPSGASRSGSSPARADLVPVPPPDGSSADINYTVSARPSDVSRDAPPAPPSADGTGSLGRPSSVPPPPARDRTQPPAPPTEDPTADGPR
jgi:hypothetical protein